MLAWGLPGAQISRCTTILHAGISYETTFITKMHFARETGVCVWGGGGEYDAGLMGSSPSDPVLLKSLSNDPTDLGNYELARVRDLRLRQSLCRLDTWRARAVVFLVVRHF